MPGVLEWQESFGQQYVCGTTPIPLSLVFRAIAVSKYFSLKSSNRGAFPQMQLGIHPLARSLQSQQQRECARRSWGGKRETNGE
jgi:hypothetical protein